jgi:hypothetical protein
MLAATVLGLLLLSACDDREPPPFTGIGSGSGGSAADAGCPGVSNCCIPTSSQTIYANSPTALYVVDPVSWIPSLVGSFGVADPMTDLAVSPDNEIFTISLTSLYRIDPSSGSATKVLDLPGDPLDPPYFNGLSALPDGTLLAVDIAGRIVGIDLVNQTTTSIGDYLRGFSSAGDLVAVDNGTVYGVSTTNEDGIPVANDNVLITVDPKTGAATTVGYIGLGNVFGLGYYGGTLLRSPPTTKSRASTQPPAPRPCLPSPPTPTGELGSRRSCPRGVHPKARVEIRLKHGERGTENGEFREGRRHRRQIGQRLQVAHIETEAHPAQSDVGSDVAAQGESGVVERVADALTTGRGFVEDQKLSDSAGEGPHRAKVEANAESEVERPVVDVSIEAVDGERQLRIHPRLEKHATIENEGVSDLETHCGIGLDRAAILGHSELRDSRSSLDADLETRGSGCDEGARADDHPRPSDEPRHALHD